MQLGYSSITWGGLTADARGVTGLADARYRIAGDVTQALRDIAAAGYSGVELFDGTVAETGVDTLRVQLDDAGLALAGVYTGGNFVYPDALPDELERIRRTAEQARRAGTRHLVVGGGARRAVPSADDDHAQLAHALDAVASLADAEGLTACFHPHLGTIAESPQQITTVLEQSRIGLCVDTAHVAAGGGDPARLTRRYPDRLQHVHLKDLRDGAFQPLGAGDLDLDDVLRAVSESAFDGWLIVELDEYAGNPADAARTSKRFLDKAFDRVDLGARVTNGRTSA